MWVGGARADVGQQHAPGQGHRYALTPPTPAPTLTQVRVAHDSALSRLVQAGKKLCGAVEAFAVGAGFSWVVLTTGNIMDKAQGLYASAGYGEGYDLKVRSVPVPSVHASRCCAAAEHLLLVFVSGQPRRSGPAPAAGRSPSKWPEVLNRPVCIVTSARGCEQPVSAQRRRQLHSLLPPCSHSAPDQPGV